MDALDRIVERYEERGKPLSQAEINKRLKIIRKKYATGSAVAAGLSVAAPAVKRHYHWEPSEGTLVKGKPKDFAAAWEKVAAAYSDYTLCPDRPGAGTQARFAGEQKVAWQRKKGKDENGEDATFLRLLKLTKGFVVQEGYMLKGSGYPDDDEKPVTGDNDDGEDDGADGAEGDQSGDDQDDDDAQEEPEEGNAKNNDKPDKAGSKRGARGGRAAAAAPAAAPAKGPKRKRP